MSKNKYSQAIEFLTEKFKAELMEEDEVFGDIIIQDDVDENNQSGVNILNLSEISTAEILCLKISKLSLFKDMKWDWRQEGSPIYKDRTYFLWDKNIALGVSLVDNENNYLCHLLKMIAFYSLPQNACLQNVRSYTTSVAILNQLLHLGRFLYKYKLFVDTKGGGTFTGATYLQREHFLSYLENDIKNTYSKYDFAKQVKHWRALSQNKLLPVEYRLNFDPFKVEEYKKIAYEMEQNKGTYMPISIDTLSKLVPICIDFIDKYSSEIFHIYDIFWPIIAGKRTPEVKKFDWMEAIGKLSVVNSQVFNISVYQVDLKEIKMSMVEENKLITAISNHKKWNKNNPLYCKGYRKLGRYNLLDISLKLGIKLDFFDISAKYDFRKMLHGVERLVCQLRNACVVILFLVTGMRNSEMYLLKINNCKPIEGTKDDFRIKIDVSKTSVASSGDPVFLPIPEIGYKAFKCLETLSEKARIYYKSDKLLLNLTTCFGSEVQQNTINAFITKWCKDLGIEHIHPHQFRKTIAMFAIYQNHNNVGIIKRLFSHKSLAMTLAYIVKLPGMDEEIKLAVIEQNKQLLGELLEAIDNKCIGGKAGNRIKTVLSESKIFKSRLHDDGWESLEQYIEILLQDGLKILHRTSFGAICTNTHSGLTHLGPETCNCNVVDCEWAVFTEASIEDLKNDIKFHRKLLEKNCTDEQKQFSSVYIKNSLERLSELQGRECVNMQFPNLINTET